MQFVKVPATYNGPRCTVYLIRTVKNMVLTYQASVELFFLTRFIFEKDVAIYDTILLQLYSFSSLEPSRIPAPIGALAALSDPYWILATYRPINFEVDKYSTN